MTQGLDTWQESRAQILAVFEEMYPHILGNPYIKHWPHPKQAKALGAYLQRKDPESKKPHQLLYGGAAGGGKSDVIAMGLSQFAWVDPTFTGAVFRRSLQDMVKADGIIPRLRKWWMPHGVAWNGTDKQFTFPNGATVQIGYMSEASDHERHQGVAYHQTFWDELTQHPESFQYEYIVNSRQRRSANSGTPMRVIATANPGGAGHVWVKQHFIGHRDERTGEWHDSPHEFIPARVAENPGLDVEAYIETLSDLNPTLRQQLLDGDWDARDPGDYFRREWFGPLLDPETDAWPNRDKVTVRWWDLAASEREDACRTAGVKMSRHRSGVRAVEHAIAFKATPGKRDAKILQMAQADGYHCVVGIEIEPGSGGPAQFEALQKLLTSHGYRVTGAKPKAEINERLGRTLSKAAPTEKGKMARADPVASCLERGYQRRGEGIIETAAPMPWFGADEHLPHTHQRDGIRLYAGPWTQNYLDEVESFPDITLMDQVDATTGAWAYLQANAFGFRNAPDTKVEKPKVNSDDVYLADEDDEDDSGVDQYGRYTP